MKCGCAKQSLGVIGNRVLSQGYTRDTQLLLWMERSIRNFSNTPLTLHASHNIPNCEIATPKMPILIPLNVLPGLTGEAFAMQYVLTPLSKRLIVTVVSR